jgi:hypothetical protein
MVKRTTPGQIGVMALPRILLVLGLVVPVTPVIAAELVITDFNAAATGSYNPRADWSAFGAGTTDRGVLTDGSVGRGAYHSVNWGGSSWGIGDKELFRDLSAYDAVRLDARVVGISGYAGTPLLRFNFNLADGTEWSTPTVPITASYATYTFTFESLALRSGSSPLDLANAQPKLIVEKNDQVGTARFDFDEVVAFTTNGAGDPYELTPVVLSSPPDGDAVRGLWFYPGTIFDTRAESQAVLDLCAREGINRLYLGGYSIWGLGSVLQQERLRTFVATAHDSGIRIEAMFGDVSWPGDPQRVRDRIDQVLAIHEATPGNTNDDFDALHFDVEFWTGSAWDAAANEAERRQIAIDFFDNVLANARTHLDANGGGDMKISVDLWAHMENSSNLPTPFLYAGSTQHFLGHLFDLADDVVIMSYIDYAGGLWNWTNFELDIAVAKGRTIQLGADIQPVPPALPINSFADDAPTGYAAMTRELEAFHGLLSSAHAAVLDGFAVFQYTGYVDEAPDPHNLADLDGDADADVADAMLFELFLLGPGVPAVGLARDGDFDGDGKTTLVDFAIFTRCFTGSGVTAPVPPECAR